MHNHDTQTLRREGRALAAPFQLATGSDASSPELTCRTILRHLPGKRLVCSGTWQEGTPVVAKIFLDPKWAERHCRRELRGIEALQAAGIPTPDLIFQGRLMDGQAPLLIFREMEGFDNLAERLSRAANDQERLGALEMVVPSIARLHAAGLRQQDIHPGNFLLSGDRVVIIDGDDVAAAGRIPLSPKASLANLALFLAQFPPHFDGMAPRLTKVYAASRNWPPHAAPAQSIDDQIRAWRQWRLEKFLPKTQRSCTAFIARKNWRRFMVCDREWYSPAKQPLLDDPDAFIAAGAILKAGNSAAVARIGIDDQDLVIKRYNIKTTAHALRRGLRPSRAMVSWKNAHRLRFLGIDTPRPLAAIEERWGILRRRAYFIMAHQPGQTIDAALRAGADNPRAVGHLLDQLEELIKRLAAARISHGDFKATNFLLSSGRLSLVDLDGLKAHKTVFAFNRAFRKDLSRLERNWLDLPLVSRLLAQRLPSLRP